MTPLHICIICIRIICITINRLVKNPQNMGLRGFGCCYGGFDIITSQLIPFRIYGSIGRILSGPEGPSAGVSYNIDPFYKNIYTIRTKLYDKVLNCTLKLYRNYYYISRILSLIGCCHSINLDASPPNKVDSL